MGRLARVALTIALMLALAAPLARAQMSGLVIVEDPLNEVQLQAEHEDIEKLLNDPDRMARAGLRRHDYCLACKGGARRPCVAPFGGETGKVFCASQCTYKCRSTCGVTAAAC